MPRNPAEQNQALECEPHASELRAMDKDELVEYSLGQQRAFSSLSHAVTLYKRQLSTLRERTSKSHQVSDLARKFSVTEIETICDVAVEDLAGFFGAGYAAIFLYDEESELLVLQRSRPELPPQPALDLRHDVDVVTVDVLNDKREPVIIESVRAYEALRGREFRCIAAEEPLAEGGLLCPLVVSLPGEARMTVGALLFGDKPEGFTRYDAQVATMMTEMISASVGTARLIERMSLLAETDGLTGLYNHRHFQQELNRALATSQRYGQPLTLAMIDIDFFKQFNDRYGHQAGDHVLREVSRFIRQSVRDTIDIVARYGGEEFAVIMPSTDLEGARVAMERLRGCVESSHMHIGGEPISVTVSIGIAESNPNSDNGTFIDAADMALYRAKREGRNRLELAGAKQFG